MVRSIIIGASGYTGGELVSILSAHPGVELTGMYSSPRTTGAVQSAGKEKRRTIASLFPALRHLADIPIKPLDMHDDALRSADVALLATPHGVSHTLAPRLLELGIVVIDLSGAYRLSDISLYEQYYGFTHLFPDLVRQAAYGIPELFRDTIRSAQLVAVAGCYPTASVLAIRPVYEAGLTDRSWGCVIDAVSGVSGAGRAMKSTTHFCEVSYEPYGVHTHRHGPEIREHAGVGAVFTPHLGAFKRGILSTIHLRLKAGVSSEDVRRVYANAYDNELFVRLVAEGAWPSVAGVERTNFCDIGWAIDERGSHMVCISAIDNLVKGASGQAMQCLNVRFGLPETMGLIPEAVRAGAARQVIQV